MLSWSYLLRRRALSRALLPATRQRPCGETIRRRRMVHIIIIPPVVPSGPMRLPPERHAPLGPPRAFLLRPLQPQMPPQGVTLVFGAEQTAALQHRHHLLHKVLQARR